MVSRLSLLFSMTCMLFFPVLIKAEPSRIAIMQFTSTSLEGGEALALTDALRSELIRSNAYEVMERTQMKEVLAEQGFQKSGACDDASCVVEIGQLLGVDFIIIGSIGKVGKTYTFSARMVDIKTGKILREAMENYKGEKDNLLLKIIPLLASKLVVKTPPAGAEKISKSKSDNTVLSHTNSPTTKTKKKRKPFIITTVTVVVVAAIAIPTILIVGKKKNTTPTDSKITVGQLTGEYSYEQ